MSGAQPMSIALELAEKASVGRLSRNNPQLVGQPPGVVSQMIDAVEFAAQWLRGRGRFQQRGGCFAHFAVHPGQQKSQQARCTCWPRFQSLRPWWNLSHA
jgi:hypothetical protein